MTPRHAVRSANRQALIGAAQHLAAASSSEDTAVAMAALREALVPYADRERTMRPPKAKPEPEERQDLGVVGSRGEIRLRPFWSPEPQYRLLPGRQIIHLTVNETGTREVVTLTDNGMEISFESVFTSLEA